MALGNTISKRTFGLAATAMVTAAGLTVATPAAHAADMTMNTYDVPGTYWWTVPTLATSTITLQALGGAGYSGDAQAGGYGGPAGAGGAGSYVRVTIPVADPSGPAGTVRWGDHLMIVVGAKGGGGQRGYGDSPGANGGNGGGVSYVYDVDQDLVLDVAGGGGGGGGGGAANGPDYRGGNGGANGGGQPGLSQGSSAGRGGRVNNWCPSYGFANIVTGQAAESPASGTHAGGGGGGGAGYCGGQGGGSGDHGAGAVPPGSGGGGGGGAGGSYVPYNTTSWTISAGFNTADGYVRVYWTPA
jgi:hypothetical protein